MTRTLRPRKSQPSYVALAGIELGDDGAGPSKRAPVYNDEDGDSGSDFAPETDRDAEGEEEGVDEDEDEDMEPEEDAPNVVPSVSITHSRRSASVLETKAKTIRNLAKPSVSRASKRQQYVLPTPSVHHRHRAVPLYTRTGRVERLETRPVLFKASKITMSNNFTQNAKVADRVNKSWGYNVGPGPIWELVEDRGWYKEAVEKVPDMDSDGNRRPKVHKNILVKAGWKVLSKSDAAPFIPTDVVTTEEGNLKPPPPVTCLLGPFGKQTETKIEMFQSPKMCTPPYVVQGLHKWTLSQPSSSRRALPIFLTREHLSGDSTGAQHTQMTDLHIALGFKQYLAVAPFPSASHSPEIGVKVARPSHGCIQIWSLGPTHSQTTPRGITDEESDRGEMKCEMVLCLESGPAHELKWCPLPSHDDFSSKRRPRKLGLLSGVFEDGSWSIYVVPYPEDVTPAGDASHPVYSIIAVYDLGPHLKTINNGTTHSFQTSFVLTCDMPDSALITDILPTHYITVHQSAIRALAWIRAPPATSTGAPRTNGDPTVIASGGYDGMECMTDIREGHGSVMNRTRDVINAMAFSPFGGGPVTIDHENIVKAYSASPSMLGRGHTLLEPQGPVWETQDRPATKAKVTKASKSKPVDDGVTKEQERIKASSVGTGAWPREVGVHRVTWNSCNGLAASGLLASATASGLCRVDELWGRWIKGKVPYGGIEHIRRELDDDAMDVDGVSDDSAGSS
ncbi:hypothetical protein C0995_009483 [Termitomyces sp. Mi166|nr:hypothetical protein C0995_009483 [Termitomyces sp. Mi166\